MSQPIDQPIDQKIRDLHRQLADLRQIDSAAQQQLLILQADINRLLETDHEADEDRSPTDAVESLAARFEADHPALSSALRSLVDSLGKAGI